MGISLGQVLRSVGRLDDSPGVDPGRARFRRLLPEDALEVDQIRSYFQEV